MYTDVELYIDGVWSGAESGAVLPVLNPATGERIGSVAHCGLPELEKSVTAAVKGLAVWRKTPAFERAKVLTKAGALIRERAGQMAELMTLEQGKVLGEARGEVDRAAESCDWMAGEALRIYGYSIPARAANVRQSVVKDPVGIVAAFTPWNFPINQLVRKILGALSAGCSIIVKAPEETPACCAELVRCFADAGLPAGVCNLLFGTPAQVSEYLVARPEVRKISFTGSTAVGKHLGALAAQHMKLTTMELGGHAPVLVFEDCGVEASARALVGNKFRNAGQSCINPTRFLVQKGVYERFVEAFVDAASKLKVGPASDAASQMGPMANGRRVVAMERLTADAVAKGAKLKLGGEKLPGGGFFYPPTVLADVPLNALAMNEEPFGPLVLLRSFETLDEAIAEANRLPFGLAAYGFTKSARIAAEITARVETGMMSINHFGLGIPETPFGGVKDSGYGFEGGHEAIEAYLQPRFITVADIG